MSTSGEKTGGFMAVGLPLQAFGLRRVGTTEGGLIPY